MTKVKICGITNMSDASLAVDLGADALGFIFYKKSPRSISKESARNIIRGLPPFTSTVGVFVDEHINIIKETVAFCNLDLLQLHGSESPAFCSSLNKRVIKALRIKEREDLEVIRSYGVCAVLLDTYYQDLHGGGGKTFNWQFATEAKRFTKRIILAGGLHPENIFEAIEIVNPYAVDVSSGVESEPGKKDPDKLKAFIKTAKKNVH
ncbi:MAG: phosphoribosylanthranilate isomerase [Thermodesulfobacteriota bacterium]|nr:phosphoribosylanthranilate isomerase [Thermodesulfobacteriota bacterium]